MNRLQLEHIIRSAGIIALSENVIIIGSQAILGEHPDAPSELLMSMEADVIIPKNQEAWNLIDGVLGEESAFHETHGYYADGVDETTAILSSNWKKRLVKVYNQNTNGIIGLCLESHDIASSKLYAGREKDIEFVSLMVSYNLIDKDNLLNRIENTYIDGTIKEITLSRAKRIFLNTKPSNLL